MVQNPRGKPRRGSFEVSLLLESKEDKEEEQEEEKSDEEESSGDDNSGESIFSKLDSFGPAKNKEALPSVEKILEILAEKFA